MSLPERVTVVGAGGTMGAGIAAAFAAAGSAVVGVVRSPDRIEAARQRAGAIGERIRFTADLDDGLADATLVIESVAEAIEPKRAVLTRVCERCRDAIVTTNTSSLPLAALVEGLAGPERFAAYHWINPPGLVEVVEIVPAAATAPATIDQLAAWTEALGKVPAVLRRDVPGFILNRLQYAVLREAWDLIESGVCDFADIDRVMTRGLGARWAAIGPFEVVDLAGLDVHLAVAEQMFAEVGGPRPVPQQLRDTVARGDLGLKTGRGLLGDYGADARAAIVERRERVMTAVREAQRG